MNLKPIYQYDDIKNIKDNDVGYYVLKKKYNEHNVVIYEEDMFNYQN